MALDQEDVALLKRALSTVYRNNFELSGPSQIVATVLAKNGHIVKVNPDSGRITVTKR